MAYDSFYGDLSTRGTANDILSQVLVAQQNVEMTSNEVEVLSNRVLADAQTIIGSISSAVSAAAQADAASLASQANRTASAASAAQAQQAAIDAISNGAAAVVIANRAEVASQAADKRAGQAIEVANSIDGKVNTATQTANTAKATAESANSNAIAATQAANNAAGLVGGKVNRSGDTFSGDVFLSGSGARRLSVIGTTPGLELHKPGVVAGMWYINGQNQFTLGQTGGNGNVTKNLFTVDTGGTAYAAGGLDIQGGANFRSRLDVGGSLSIGGSFLANNGIATKNGNLDIYASQPASNAHVWFYSPDATQRGCFYVDSGGTARYQNGQGREILRMQSDGNVVAPGQFVSEQRMYANNGLTVSKGGMNVSGDIRTDLGMYTTYLASSGQVLAENDVIAKRNVYAGNGGGLLQGDGNVYGAVWGGEYLSQYLEKRYVTLSSFDSRIANWNANIGAGAIGTHGFLANVSGQNIGVNGTLGTGLNWAASGNPNGGSAGGTWRCLGYGFNGSYTLWVRVA